MRTDRGRGSSARKMAFEIVAGEFPVGGGGREVAQEVDFAGFLEAGDYLLQYSPEAVEGQAGQQGGVVAQQPEEEGVADEAGRVVQQVREELVRGVVQQFGTGTGWDGGYGRRRCRTSSMRSRHFSLRLRSSRCR